MERRDSRARRAAIAGTGLSLGLGSIVGLAAVAVCGYRFGVEDQAQYLVQVMAIEDPSLFEGDPYTTAFGALWSIFWAVIAAVTDETTRASGVLLVHIAIAITNVLLIGAIIRPMLPASVGPVARRVGAFAVPALLVVPKEMNWFGLVSISDRDLTATVGAMPLVFVAMLCWTRGRCWWCLVACLVAVPVHAQTGAYLLAAWGWAMTIRSWHERCAGVACMSFVMGGLGVSGVLALAWRVPSSVLGRYEAVGLGLYPELVDPLRAPLTSWGATCVILVMGLIAGVRLHDPADDARGVRSLSIWAIGSLVLPAVGLLAYASGVREPFLWKLMVGRSLMLPQIAGVLLVGVWCLRASCAPSVSSWVGGMTVLVLVALWPIEGAGAAVGLLMPVVAIGVMVCVRAGRLPPEGARRGVLS